LNAKNARSPVEEEAWLDLASDWTTLAVAFDQEDGSKMNGGQATYKE
jgi:hypothetical protein